MCVCIYFVSLYYVMLYHAKFQFIALYMYIVFVCIKLYILYHVVLNDISYQT